MESAAVYRSEVCVIIMVRRNNQTNKLIMWSVIVGDFLLLNAILLCGMWSVEGGVRQLFVLNNLALLISEWKFHAEIHERFSTSGEMLKKIVELTVVHALIAYALMRHMMYWMKAGEMLLGTGTIFFISLIILRMIERNTIKYFRRTGWNTRTVTLVGDDKELNNIREQLINNPTTGYRVRGVWSEKSGERNDVWQGTVCDLCQAIKDGRPPELGDEMYVCISRKEKDAIRLVSRECDKQVTKFYFVPVSVESIGLNLKREYINDIEVFATHDTPLEDFGNRLVKRGFDVVLSTVILMLTALFYPLIWLIINKQSPGPIFFRQERTGLDGKNFTMMKFRSMHVNKDADRVQATKDDPRKFPFGNFMRKANIDELPQFWNVLKGNMSIVGPRPHMLAHTEMYSKLIDQYMVRHFVKPGVTGWAQVTGFRGETKELWQMEGRVKRDIWYMEHWSIWLDVRIVWLTIKTIFVHDKNAY